MKTKIPINKNTDCDSNWNVTRNPECTKLYKLLLNLGCMKIITHVTLKRTENYNITTNTKFIL